MKKYGKIPKNLPEDVAINQLNPLKLENGDLFYGYEFLKMKKILNDKKDNNTQNSSYTYVVDNSKEKWFDEETTEMLKNNMLKDLQNGKYATTQNLMNVLIDNTKLKMENNKMQTTQMNMLMQLTKLQKGVNK